MAKTPAQANENPKWNATIEARNEKATYYFQSVLKAQDEWYSTKADMQKQRHLFFAISVIVLGAIVSLLQIIETADWIKYLTATLGVTISVLRALDSLLRPGETWQAYRKASENMKRELRLYINNADDYQEANDEQAAYQLFVERIELVLAEEQQLYWQFHAKTPIQEPASETGSEQK